MALFLSKIDTVSKVLTENIHSNIKYSLKEKLMARVEEDIEAIVNEVVDDLVSKIETFHDMTGEIRVNVKFEKIKNNV